MASGKTHKKATVATSIPTTLLSAITLNPQFLLGVVIGNLVALVYNPDSDISGETHSENILLKIPAIGVIMKMLSMMITQPYAAVFVHRSQYSHTPVLSDIIRYLYAEIFIYLFSLIFTLQIPALLGVFIDSINYGNLHSLVHWLNWISSPLFLGIFITSVIQTCVHTLFLDGSMVYKPNKNGKGNKRHYILGKNWYDKCKKWFG